MSDLPKERGIPLGEPIELVALAVKKTAIRCRTLDSNIPITLRKVRWEVEGEIITVRPGKLWRFKNTNYMSGDVESVRIDIPALKLKPLVLNDPWPWKPEEEYWGEPDDPTFKYFKNIIDFGSRTSYEMEQVLPWGRIDNRPFLRCLHGYGLSLWRMGEAEEARRHFERMLWLNPSDNQGVRSLLLDMDEGKTWEDVSG